MEQQRPSKPSTTRGTGRSMAKRCMEARLLRPSSLFRPGQFHECQLALDHFGPHICWCEMSFTSSPWSKNDVTASELSRDAARAMEESRRPDRRSDPAEPAPEAADAPG
jgi:hypothetical protein